MTWNYKREKAGTVTKELSSDKLILHTRFQVNIKCKAQLSKYDLTFIQREDTCSEKNADATLIRTIIKRFWEKSLN